MKKVRSTVPFITPTVRRPTRKEIDLYYKTHRSQFFAPERVHVLQIVKNVELSSDRISAELAISDALLRLQAGEAFPKVADELSDCPGNGGDLGWFPRGVMVEEFDNVVFELTPAELSGVFETRFGFHIVRMIEKRGPGLAPLSEVYDLIADTIYENRLLKIPK